MGFAGHDLDAHLPLWKQTVERWKKEAPEKFERWQELVAGGASEKEAWEQVASG
jgi:hypothetical protein